MNGYVVCQREMCGKWETLDLRKENDGAKRRRVYRRFPFSFCFLYQNIALSPPPSKSSQAIL